jgi:DNA ligase 1
MTDRVFSARRHNACVGLLLLASLLRTQSAAGDDAALQAGESARGAPPDAERRVGIAKPALALADVYAPGVGLGGYLMSEKLDGVRAYWDGSRLITRGGHLIRAPDWFTAGLPPVPLDGELWLGRGRFAEASGAARRLEPDPETWRDMRYMLFDLPGGAGDFRARLAVLERLVAAAGNAHVVLLEQVPVSDDAALQARLAEVTAAGGEGLMLRRIDAPYRPGRSDDLLKVKAFQEGDARVVGHLPGRGKHAGRLGALLVELPDGRRFRIGTGFTDAEREAPPPLGSRVSFKHHGLTRHGLPRFASFLHVNDDF